MHRWFCLTARASAGRLRASVAGMRSVRAQVALAMLLALNVVLSYFGAVYLTQDLKISTSFLAMAATAYLFGPVPAALSGALTDVIQYLLRPVGPFFPGYMISGIFNGLILGGFLYRREGRALKIAIPVARLITNLFVNVCLNTLWLHLLYGTPVVALLPPRLLKNAVLYPVEVALMYGVVLFLEHNRERLLRRG